MAGGKAYIFVETPSAASHLRQKSCVNPNAVLVIVIEPKPLVAVLDEARIIMPPTGCRQASSSATYNLR
jgi:hypothetical protein